MIFVQHLEKSFSQIGKQCSVRIQTSDSVSEAIRVAGPSNTRYFLFVTELNEAALLLFQTDFKSQTDKPAANAVKMFETHHQNHNPQQHAVPHCSMYYTATAPHSAVTSHVVSPICTVASQIMSPACSVTSQTMSPACAVTSHVMSPACATTPGACHPLTQFKTERLSPCELSASTSPYHTAAVDDFHHVTGGIHDLPPTPESIYDHDQQYDVSKVYKHAHEALTPWQQGYDMTPPSDYGDYAQCLAYEQLQAFADRSLYGNMTSSHAPLPASVTSSHAPLPTSLTSSHAQQPVSVSSADKDISSIVSIVASMMEDDFPTGSGDSAPGSGQPAPLLQPKLEPMESCEYAESLYSSPSPISRMLPSLHVKQETLDERYNSCSLQTDFQTNFAFQLPSTPSVKTEEPRTKCPPAKCPPTYTEYIQCRQSGTSSPERSPSASPTSDAILDFTGCCFQPPSNEGEEHDFQVKPGSTFQEMCVATGVMNGESC